MFSDDLGPLLGLESHLADGEDKALLPGGTTTLGNIAVYPSTDDLLTVLTARHERNADII